MLLYRCKAAAKIVKSINSNLPVMEPVIDHAIRQFETAMEETGMPEAAVNYLLMLIIKWDSLRSEKKTSFAVDSLMMQIPLAVLVIVKSA